MIPPAIWSAAIAEGRRALIHPPTKENTMARYSENAKIIVRAFDGERMQDTETQDDREPVEPIETDHVADLLTTHALDCLNHVRNVRFGEGSTFYEQQDGDRQIVVTISIRCTRMAGK